MSKWPEENARADLAFSRDAKIASAACLDGLPYLPYKNSSSTSAVPLMMKLDVIVIGGTTARLQSQSALKTYMLRVSQYCRPIKTF